MVAMGTLGSRGAWAYGAAFSTVQEGIWHAWAGAIAENTALS